MEAIVVKSAAELADTVISECAQRLIEYRGEQTYATLHMRRQAKAEVEFLLNLALGLMPKIKVQPQKVFKDTPSNWQTMQNERDRRVIGKLLEEVAELGQAAARCLIQGIDECEPSTGVSNRAWLENEIADTSAMMSITEKMFGLDVKRMHDRMKVKVEHKMKWIAMPVPEHPDSELLRMFAEHTGCELGESIQEHLEKVAVEYSQLKHSNEKTPFQEFGIAVIRVTAEDAITKARRIIEDAEKAASRMVADTGCPFNKALELAAIPWFNYTVEKKPTE